MDIIKDYNKFFTAECGYPRFKSKKHDKKAFRIQNNSNIDFSKVNVVRSLVKFFKKSLG